MKGVGPQEAQEPGTDTLRLSRPASALPGPPWVKGGAGWAEPPGRGTPSSQPLHFRLGSAQLSKLPLTQVGAVEGMVSETLSPGQAGGFLL